MAKMAMGGGMKMAQCSDCPDTSGKSANASTKSSAKKTSPQTHKAAVAKRVAKGHP